MEFGCALTRPSIRPALTTIPFATHSCLSTHGALRSYRAEMPRQYNALTSDTVLRRELPACRMLHVALRTSPVNRMDAASVRRCVDVPGQD